MDTYRRVLKYLRPYRLRFGLAVVCTVFVGALNAVPALLVRYAVDDVLIAKEARMAFLLSIGVVAIFILKGGSPFAKTISCTGWASAW